MLDDMAWLCGSELGWWCVRSWYDIQMVYWSMRNNSEVADELYTRRVYWRWRISFLFSLYSFCCIAKQVITLKQLWSFSCFDSSRYELRLLCLVSEITCSLPISPTIDSASATTLVSVWNTWVFQMALTALTEPRTLWWGITRFPSPRRLVALHNHLHYYGPGIRTIRTTRVLHSSQGLQLCCSCSHNAWWCLCLSSANSHILPLSYCYISDAALVRYMFSFEILSHIAIQSSLRILRLPLHLLLHYRILQVWNIQSKNFTV